MMYFCCDEKRRDAVRDARPVKLNGIDFLEVVSKSQKELEVHFIHSPSGPAGAISSLSALTIDNFAIEGGARISGIQVVSIKPDRNVVTVIVDKAGDYSDYTLKLVSGKGDQQPPEGYDPRLCAVTFCFKIDCPSDFDCRPECPCPPETPDAPEIDYLAKDYASFRRLMLDRMSLLAPQWRERNPADLGVALVELLAYAGDYLSYRQDAVATEAYLETARRRVSLRRHARLVDYFMHDGCNARAWIQVQVDADSVQLKRLATLPSGAGTPTQFFVHQNGLPPRIAPGSEAHRAVLAASQPVFELLDEDARLYSAHNKIDFYTWDDELCCLPKGATKATLADPAQRLRLKPNGGDVLVFEEVLGPKTGDAADADRTHRHAVRLTAATRGMDPLKPNRPIVDIEWSVADALPFPLCISARKDAAHGGGLHIGISVAHGNIVLADHGRTLDPEDIGQPPAPSPLLTRVPALHEGCCDENALQTPTPRLAVYPRYRPALHEGPLTQAAPYIPGSSASEAMAWEKNAVLPAVKVTQGTGNARRTWTPRRDLLGSGPDDTHFVVEIENDGVASLRFGDGQYGKRPLENVAMKADYRVGNGGAGNVAAETLQHVMTHVAGIRGVRNLLPARGGVEPESMEQVRQNAPYAFRTQQRAVTEADYAEMAQRDEPGLQRAAATFRWTGSWHTVFVTADRRGGAPVDQGFKDALRDKLERYRMAGHDLEVDSPRPVSLEIEMHVCVKAGHFRSHVKQALLEIFSNRDLPDGRRGLFHPDNFSFGQTVFLSPLYAAAQAVAGVASVTVTRFGRQGELRDAEPAADRIELGDLEIARLDNDPNFPEHGVFRITLGGGK